MGSIPLPIPTYDWHMNGHPPAFAAGQPDPCPFCIDPELQDLRPPVSVAVKLASIAAHVEEFNGGEGHTADLIAATSLCSDPEVVAYLALLRPLALLPVPR